MSPSRPCPSSPPQFCPQTICGTFSALIYGALHYRHPPGPRAPPTASSSDRPHPTPLCFQQQPSPPEVTHLRRRTPICSFLQFPSNFFGFLRKSAVSLQSPAPSICLNFKEKRRICNKLRFFYENLRFGPSLSLRSVPLSAP